jgi:hypothetical protein
MNRISRAVREHRSLTRTRRDITRAINESASPAMRDELLTMAQRQGLPLR